MRDSETIDEFKATILIALLLILFGLIWEPFNDYDHYCEMVEIWENNKHIPEEHRPGWPPYDGDCEDEK